MTAEDNLEFFGRIYQIPASERSRRIKALLSRMDLWGRRSEPVRKWSRGMKQRLALARVLLHNPPLIFLDEPTAGLDVLAAQAVRTDIAALVNQYGTTVFLTTHNLAEAEKLCKRVAVIRSGSLVAVGSPDELKRRAQKPQIEITGSGFTHQVLGQLRSHPGVTFVQVVNEHLEIHLERETPISDLVNLMVLGGVQVEEVRHCKANLEETFLALMKDSIE
jgi:ABC-2 type transport system ATP-binding protein